MADNQNSFRGWVSHSDWDGASAECVLEVVGWTLKCEFETGSLELPLEGLQIEYQRGKVDQVWFSHPKFSDWSLQTDDKKILQARGFEKNFQVQQQILAIQRQQDDWRRLKATGCFLAGFMVVALLAMNLSGWVLNMVVRNMPMSYETKLGTDVSKKLKSVLTFVSAPEVTNQLKTNIVHLLGSEWAAKYDPKIEIYFSGLPNAFVAPGGRFYVSSSLLAIASSPEEIAGVLAHESAHLKNRHVIRSLIARMGHAFLFQWLFGDQDNLLSAIADGSDILVNQAYSRELEYEADDQGWDMLVAANIDPRGEIEMLKKLDQELKKLGVDERSKGSDHPVTEDRIKRLTEKWNKCPKKSGFVTLEKIEWKDAGNPKLDQLLRILK